MYCRKCLKETGKASNGKAEENKVNMNIDMEEQCYICPDCGHVIYWQKEDDN